MDKDTYIADAGEVYDSIMDVVEGKNKGIISAAATTLLVRIIYEACDSYAEVDEAVDKLSEVIRSGCKHFIDTLPKKDQLDA